MNGGNVNYEVIFCADVDESIASIPSMSILHTQREKNIQPKHTIKIPISLI